MRIVAGTFGSRRLVAPPGADTRPTSDRAREALFQMLGDIDGARVLDCFAGSGALGLEALSRGAAVCTFVERDRAAVAALHANVASLDVAARCRVRTADVRRALRADAAAGRQYDLFLIDPPYRMLMDVLPALDRLLGILAAPGARLALESSAGEEPVVSGFQLDRRRRAGAATLSLFTRAEDSP
jgi:16S rRNA (guanine966-N2)-methyltransferase